MQVPISLLRYAGSPPAHLALHLYAQGAGVSYRADETGADVCFRVRVKTKRKATNLTLRSTFSRLETDGYIQRKRERIASGRHRASRIYLLDPLTGDRLKTHPNSYGLLSENAQDECFSFITLPRDCLKAIDEMECASEKALFLAALCLVSKARDECVEVARALWRALAHVSKNSFTSALRSLTNKKLLSYRRGVLTLHDPLTGKPVERWRYPRKLVNHENAQWAFDLNKVTAEEWHAVLERALRVPIPFFDGWHTVKELGCPFCGECGKFSLSFESAGFKCHAACKEHGKLGQLVKHVLGVEWDAVKEYIKETGQAVALATV